MTELSVMFWPAGGVAWLVALFHAGRTASGFRGLSGWVRVISVGVSATLILLAAGLIARAVRRDEFLWIHWLILAGLVVTLVGYIGATANDRKERFDASVTESHQRAHVALQQARDELDQLVDASARLSPCPTEDCVRGRADLPVTIAHIKQRIADADQALT